MKINLKNVLLYLLGLKITSLAVILMKSTEIGLGSWDAVIANFELISKLPFSVASLIINVVLVSFAIIYKRNFKYLLVAIPILLNMGFLHFWDQFVFKNLVLYNLYSKVGIFVISTFLLPLGLSLIVISTLPKMIYEELTFILMEIFKTNNFAVVRLGFEIFALLLAMILGLIGSSIFNQIGIGTVIVTFSIGPLIDLYLKIFKYEKVQATIIN